MSESERAASSSRRTTAGTTGTPRRPAPVTSHPHRGRRTAGSPSSAPAPARIGTPAPSTRARFVPTSVELPGRGSAPVVAERTVDGTLQIPEDISSIGWWDGSAIAGDPFGATVLAGHIDSRTQGLGFFAALLLVGRGDRITVRNGAQTLTYRVDSTQLIRKDALAADGHGAVPARGPSARTDHLFRAVAPGTTVIRQQSDRGRNAGARGLSRRCGRRRQPPTRRPAPSSASMPC